jgi:hypothetical protein
VVISKEATKSRINSSHQANKQRLAKKSETDTFYHSSSFNSPLGFSLLKSMNTTFAYQFQLIRQKAGGAPISDELPGTKSWALGGHHHTISVVCFCLFIFAWFFVSLPFFFLIHFTQSI